MTPLADSIFSAEDIKPVEKRKVLGEADAVPQTTRKRAKTNASIDNA